MNRRGFLKAFCGAAAGTVAVVAMPPVTWTAPEPAIVTTGIETLFPLLDVYAQAICDQFFAPSPFYEYLKANRKMTIDGGRTIKPSRI